MRTRARTKGEDQSQIAVRTIEAVIGGPLVPKKGRAKSKKKNMHAFALSQLGAAKGGHARAAKLTDEQRRESARKAAQARWGKP